MTAVQVSYRILQEVIDDDAFVCLTDEMLPFPGEFYAEVSVFNDTIESLSASDMGTLPFPAKTVPSIVSSVQGSSESCEV
jgi:hypothetical protein